MAEARAISDAPPAWDEIDEELLCPLCHYNLRGLIEPRCPECGGRFAWPDLLDPTRRLHPYLFEHHPDRNIVSFCKTVLGGLAPRRFWSALHPVQPSRPRRLLLYWVLCAGIFFVCAAADSVAEAVGVYRRTVAARNAWIAQCIAIINNPARGDYRQHVIRQWGSTQAWLDSVRADLRRDGGPRWVAARAVAKGFVATAVLPLVWPWLTVLALMVFQISMHRARVRTIHVLRCVVYSSDVLLWASPIPLAATAAPFLLAGTMWGPGIINVIVLASTVALWCVVLAAWVWRLRTAYQQYLQFDHSFATVFVSQALVALFAATAVASPVLFR